MNQLMMRHKEVVKHKPRLFSSDWSTMIFIFHIQNVTRSELGNYGDEYGKCFKSSKMKPTCDHLWTISDLFETTYNPWFICNLSETHVTMCDPHVTHPWSSCNLPGDPNVIHLWPSITHPVTHLRLICNLYVTYLWLMYDSLIRWLTHNLLSLLYTFNIIMFNILINIVDGTQ